MFSKQKPKSPPNPNRDKLRRKVPQNDMGKKETDGKVKQNVSPSSDWGVKRNLCHGPCDLALKMKP